MGAICAAKQVGDGRDFVGDAAVRGMSRSGGAGHGVLLEGFIAEDTLVDNVESLTEEFCFV
jgi:hypothetical protein